MLAVSRLSRSDKNHHCFMFHLPSNLFLALQMEKQKVQVKQRIMHNNPQLLFQTDHFRQDSAVEEKLDMLSLGALNSVLPDDGEEEGLVPDVVRPHRDHPLSGRGQVNTLSKDVGEGARGGGKTAGWEGTGSRGISSPVSH